VDPLGGPFEGAGVGVLIAGEFDDIRVPMSNGKRSITLQDEEQISATSGPTGDLPYHSSNGQYDSGSTGVSLPHNKNSRQLKWELARFPAMPEVSANIESWAASIYAQDFAWRFRPLVNGDSFAVNISLNN
jgi:hypothetical protein